MTKSIVISMITPKNATKFNAIKKGKTMKEKITGTVITFNEASSYATINTNNKRLIRRLKKVSEINSRIIGTVSAGGRAVYTLPKTYITIKCRASTDLTT